MYCVADYPNLRNTPSFQREYSLPFGYRVTFFYPLGRVEWAPDVPSIRQRRAQSKFFAAYRAARHEFYEEVAALTGLRMLIVDSPDLANVVGTDVILPPAKH